MTALQAVLADEFAADAAVLAARLCDAAACWAAQERAGRRPRAAVAMGNLLLAARAAGAGLAGWRVLGFTPLGLLPLPSVLRLLVGLRGEAECMVRLAT